MFTSFVWIYHYQRFETAVQMESDFREAMEKNDFATALSIYETCKPIIDQQWQDQDILQ